MNTKPIWAINAMPNYFKLCRLDKFNECFHFASLRFIYFQAIRRKCMNDGKENLAIEAFQRKSPPCVRVT